MIGPFGRTPGTLVTVVALSAAGIVLVRGAGRRRAQGM